MAITLIVLSVLALAGLIAAAVFNPIAPAAGPALTGFKLWWSTHRSNMLKGFGWALGGFLTLAIVVGILTWVFNFPLNLLAVVLFWLAIAAFVVLALGTILGWSFVKWLVRLAIALSVIALIVTLIPILGVKLPAFTARTAAPAGSDIPQTGVDQILNKLDVMVENQDEVDAAQDVRIDTIEEKVDAITESADGKTIIVNGAPAKTCEGILDYQLMDLSELSSADNLFIHVQFGRGGKEYETLLPPGRYSIVIPFVDGHVWELGPTCKADEALTKHVGPSIERRITRKVNSGGYIAWNDLVEDGTLEIIWQQPGNFEVPTSIPVVADAPADSTADSAGSGFVGRDGDADDRAIGDEKFAYLVECYEPVSGICVVPVGESISGLKGANWKYGSTDAALADAKTKGKPVYVVKDGKLGDPIK